MIEVRCPYNLENITNCESNLVNIAIPDDSAELLNSEKIGLRDLRLIEFGHDIGNEFVSFWGAETQMDSPTNINEDFNSYGVGYAPSAENNKELICIHGKLNSVVRENRGMRDENKSDEIRKNCFLYQLDPTVPESIWFLSMGS